MYLNHHMYYCNNNKVLEDGLIHVCVPGARNQSHVSLRDHRSDKCSQRKQLIVTVGIDFCRMN